ncbi:hypothetical protein L1889_18015 [Paenalcaligenes niemegkensis]|uniref:hypothetical protein n=1 Tax=Paenalcaligenes niemegkensis TaxID=2895469 RepID=UPI001EE8312A|nr:hypothetical protein [Paenalcaligenes niemegkensis]MCQ9618336.1 hypothetical protein [Paenalcaligenes niemegkensis]
MNEESFLKSVANHVMEVIHDDGLHRHIRLREPGTMHMHFDLITWPGYLCYTGDMGTYVFSRLHDMLEFFRTDREYAKRGGYQLAINLSYWSEKLQSVDGNRRNGSAMEFDEDAFREYIKECRLEWIREAYHEATLNKEQRRELWEAVEDEVLRPLDEDCREAAELAVRDFSWRPTFSHQSQTWHFQDVWEHNFDKYTHHFTWCCYALAWGIQTYDDHKAAQPVEETEKQS